MAPKLAMKTTGKSKTIATKFKLKLGRRLRRGAASAAASAPPPPEVEFAAELAAAQSWEAAAAEQEAEAEAPLPLLARDVQAAGELADEAGVAAEDRQAWVAVAVTAALAFEGDGYEYGTS